MVLLSEVIQPFQSMQMIVTSKIKSELSYIYGPRDGFDVNGMIAL